MTTDDGTPGRDVGPRRVSEFDVGGVHAEEDDRTLSRSESYATMLNDDNIMLDAADDDWAWRRKLRANPASARLYRATVAFVGLIVVTAGLLMIPFPGPGWLVVFAGLAIWGSEFERAQQVQNWVTRHVRRWDAWVHTRPRWQQGGFLVLSVLLVLIVAYAFLRVSGVPAFLPDQVERFLRVQIAL